MLSLSSFLYFQLGPPSPPLPHPILSSQTAPALRRLARRPSGLTAPKSSSPPLVDSPPTPSGIPPRFISNMIPVPAPPNHNDFEEKSSTLPQAEQNPSTKLATSLDPLQLVHLLATRGEEVLVIDTSSMESYLESRIIGSM